jgi:hypothetical protein
MLDFDGLLHCLTRLIMKISGIIDHSQITVQLSVVTWKENLGANTRLAPLYISRIISKFDSDEPLVMQASSKIRQLPFLLVRTRLYNIFVSLQVKLVFRALDMVG